MTIYIDLQRTLSIIKKNKTKKTHFHLFFLIFFFQTEYKFFTISKTN